MKADKWGNVEIDEKLSSNLNYKLNQNTTNIIERAH